MYQVGSKVFGLWQICAQLGEGSYGTVYELERQDFGITARSALKVISVPKNEAELETLLDECGSMEAVQTMLESRVRRLVEEFSLMARMKATDHIVSIEDHAVIPKSQGPGWDILIRMELLTPFPKHRREKGMTKAQVIRLGIDICRALELCREQRILHRDIKPANIMVTDRETFKLGDFGIARTLEDSSCDLSKTGTPNYMAPEVYWCQEYDYRVDIYSLGIVMYWLLNRCCLPFSPLPPEEKTHASQMEAMKRRLSGEALPLPDQEAGELAQVVLKACAYHPQDRFETPEQMRLKLEELLPMYQKESQQDPNATILDAGTAATLYGSTGGTQRKDENRMPAETKKKPWLLMIGGGAILLLGLLAGVLLGRQWTPQEEPQQMIEQTRETVPETTGETEPAQETTQATEAATEPTQETTEATEPSQETQPSQSGQSSQPGQSLPGGNTGSSSQSGTTSNPPQSGSTSTPPQSGTSGDNIQQDQTPPDETVDLGEPPKDDQVPDETVDLGQPPADEDTSGGSQDNGGGNVDLGQPPESGDTGPGHNDQILPSDDEANQVPDETVDLGQPPED